MCRTTPRCSIVKLYTSPETVILHFLQWLPGILRSSTYLHGIIAFKDFFSLISIHPNLLAMKPHKYSNNSISFSYLEIW